MEKKQKIVIAIFIIVILILIVIAAGYLYVTNTYPLKYKEEIVSYTDEYRLDPYYVASIINIESSFSIQAESHKGAIGLMQIMPTTGEWIAGKMKDKSYEQEKLLDPAFNIQYGCWYFNYLLDRYEGNYYLAAAAYNAGPNKLDGWIKDGLIELEEDGFPMGIPYQETQNYVKRLKTNYDMYQMLYEL